MKRLKEFLIVTAAASPAALFAWGGFGHAIVAEIAEERLTPEAAEKVREILAEGETLVSVASWADQVRPERRNTAPFHYVNPDENISGPEDLMQDDGNVYMAVVGYSEILIDPEAKENERAEALKFMSHFLSDLHQPLHCGYARDLGGNTVKGTFLGEETNLHRLWDTGLLESYWGDDASAEEVAGQLLMEIETEKWERDTELISWVTESNQLLIDDFYPPNHDEQPFELGQEYLDRHIGTVKQRLTQGGVRLAAVLNVLLAEQGDLPFQPLTTPLPIDREVKALPELFGEEE